MELLFNQLKIRTNKLTPFWVSGYGGEANNAIFVNRGELVLLASISSGGDGGNEFEMITKESVGGCDSDTDGGGNKDEDIIGCYLLRFVSGFFLSA